MQIKELPKYELKEHEQEKLEKILSKYRGNNNAVIPALREIQQSVGFLPVDAQRKVARGLNVPEKDVYGVVTFYSFFSMVPKGKYDIRVCMGTACYVKGGGKIVDKIKKELGIEPGQTTPDRKYSLQVNRCLGACGIAPVVVINDKILQKVDPKKIIDIIYSYK
ncbi:MAG: NADH-quinone oxidoreductase subunit NuoE [Candidatus Humimicrobiaceae bacterium]